MDFLNNWTLNDSELFSLADLSSTTIPFDPTPGVWSWSDHPTTIGDSLALDTEGRDSSNSSRKSSEAREIGSLWGAKVVSADLEVESQGQPLVMEKEPTYHRIQRRRIQNREAQRNFRQRQENVRRMLEEQLRAAENQCNKLSTTCSELNSIVNMMMDRLKLLEAENTVLRTSGYSIPWRKEST